MKLDIRREWFQPWIGDRKAVLTVTGYMEKVKVRKSAAHRRLMILVKVGYLKKSKSVSPQYFYRRDYVPECEQVATNKEKKVLLFTEEYLRPFLPGRETPGGLIGNKVESIYSPMNHYLATQRLLTMVKFGYLEKVLDVRRKRRSYYRLTGKGRDRLLGVEKERVVKPGTDLIAKKVQVRKPANTCSYGSCTSPATHTNSGLKSLKLYYCNWHFNKISSIFRND